MFEHSDNANDESSEIFELEVLSIGTTEEQVTIPY